MNPEKMALFLQSDDADRLRRAAMMAASAAAMDWEVLVIWTGTALKWLAENGPLDVEAPQAGRTGPREPDSAAEAGQPGDYRALFESSRTFGRTSFLACSADVLQAGYDEPRLDGFIDEILSMPTLLRRARDAGTKLYI